MAKALIRFDWAIKRLLRSKADYGVLEGFLTALLKEPIKIQQVLESEGNQTQPYDEMNRVDVLVENSRGELILIEVQNARESDFANRMLYGASTVITEHLNLGEGYSKIKKMICVSIVYFDLGRGEDYVYHGKTRFMGLHQSDELALNKHEQALYPDKDHVLDTYPEYYIIRVNQFDGVSKDPLDEWIYFLKTEEIKAGFTAPGLAQAKDALAVLKLSPEEQKQYRRYLESLSYEASTLGAERDAGRREGYAEGLALAKGEINALKKTAIQMLAEGLPVEMITKFTGLSSAEILEKS